MSLPKFDRPQVMYLVEERLSPHARKRFFTVLLLLLCFAISFIYGFDHLLWLHERHWDYRNTIIMTSLEAWDADLYLGQVKDVYEGNELLSNVYLAEYKQVKSPLWWPVLPIYLTAGIGKLLHLDVRYLAVLMDVTIPPLIFLLGYAFLYALSAGRSIAIGGALVFILIPYIGRIDRLLALAPRFADLRSAIPPILTDLHGYQCFSRPVYPQLIYVFLLAAMLFFAQGMLSARRSYFLLSAGCGIVISYSYPFFATYLYAFWGINLIAACVLKDRGHVRNMLGVLCITGIGAAPFWYSVFTFPKEKLAEMGWRSGGHQPVLMVGSISIALLLSGAVCLNQQIITGTIVQPGHYNTYLIPHALVLAVALLLAEYRRRQRVEPWPFFRKMNRPLPVDTLALYGGIGLGTASLLLRPEFVAAHLSTDGVLAPKVAFLLTTLHFGGAAGGVLLVLIGLGLSLTSPSPRVPHYGYLQTLAPALQWLDANTPKESVVLGSLDYCATDAAVVIYTDNNYYISTYAQFYPVPRLIELKDRVYNLLSFSGIRSENDFAQFLARDALSIFVHQMHLSFEEYQQKFKRELYPELKKYRLDYVFYGPREREIFKVDPHAYPFLKEVYQDRAVTIFQVR